MKTRLSALSLLLSCATAFAQAQSRPAMPGRSTSSRAPVLRTPADKAGPKPVTQPGKNGATQPVIPYDGNENALNFQDASADLVIMEYAIRTGRTVIKAPNVPAVNITLRTTPDNPLDDEQYLSAIESVLNLNGIALERVGDKFLRVLPFSELPKSGKPIRYEDDDAATADDADRGQFVSRMIQLKYVDTSEVQPIIAGLVRTGAQIQTIERTNSILVTDAADNVARIVELMRRIDKPIIAHEEPNIRQIRFAKATDVKARLDEIVDKSQEEESNSSKKSSTVAQNRSSGAPGAERRQLPQGVQFRNRRAEAEPQGPTTETIASMIADAQRGVLRGKVSIIADERTNVLIILTRPENMKTLDTFIEALDRPTAPEYLVEVIRLEHAVAADMKSLLDDLIGKQKTSDKDADPSVRASDDEAKAETPARTKLAAAAAKGDVGTRVGQLDSENISIIADERINALVIMASASDMGSLRSIVGQMDVQLSQVVIETVIVQLTFKDSQETGADWVKRVMAGDASRHIASALAGGGGKSSPKDVTVADFLPTSAGGIAGWFTLNKINMDVVLTAVQNDSRSRLMSSPRITTMDNKEAVLESTKRIYWSEGSTHYTTSDYYSDNIKNEDVGIKLTVTPRINKNGYIALTIEQEVQDSSETTTLQLSGKNTEFPNLSTRKMGADVAVQSGETVVLGGLADNAVTKSVSRVPILGSIPLLGRLFRYDRESTERTEIIVFLTPYVLDTPQQIEDDARRAKASMDTAGVWDASWSASRLADPLSDTQVAKVLANGAGTIAPARYPQTGYLTGLNTNATLSVDPDGVLLSNEIARATEAGAVPFVHASDLDRARRTRAAAEAEPEAESETSESEPEPAAENEPGA